MGVHGLWQFKRETSDAPAPVAFSTSNPSEDIISQNSEYTVSPDRPRRITLPTIGVEGFVQQVGVDKNGSVDVPTNINLAGWFTNSSKPGDAGVSLIDGHVSGKFHPGIFKNLESLKVGDRYEVEFGDLSRRQFEVVSVQSYSVNDVTKHMLEHSPEIKKQLNLITCSGRFDNKTQQYGSRTLVVSKSI
jgi:LPXTG-site transpeptidase (sortase) family protein